MKSTEKDLQRWINYHKATCNNAEIRLRGTQHNIKAICMGCGSEVTHVNEEKEVMC